jgi:hypothetical protein
MRVAVGYFLVATVLSHLLAVPAQAAEKKLEPGCEKAGYAYDAQKKSCVATTEMVASRSASKEVCEKNGVGVFDESVKPPKCVVKEDTPTCPGGGRVSFSQDLGACVYDSSVPVSDPKSYKGDCLKIVSKIEGAPDTDLLQVVSQSDDGQILNVVPAEKFFGPFYCHPTDAAAAQRVTPVKVSDVIQSGALRRGWVYGVLSTPFKYYPRSKGLSGATSIGPYLGVRTEHLGGALIPVLSVGVSQVQGVSTVGGSAEKVGVTAFSYAGGLIFEVSKSKSPFRLGVLVGKDNAKETSAVKFPENGKTWFAVQLGFDLVDN